MENKFSYGLKTLFIATIILLPYSTYGYVGQGATGATRALYHFCEESGTTTGDSSGYGNNGTFLAVGEPAWNSNGRFGYALDFDGINDYVKAATTNFPSSAGSYEAWVNFDDWANNQNDVIFSAPSEIPDTDTDLILHLRMNEASWTGAANEVVDVSGQGNHGTAYGGVTTGWSYKRPITLSPATSQANYQVRVELTTAIMGNPYANVKASGEDLRFYQADGTSLDYWIETWNTSSTSTIWVEVATSGTDTIYIYYGNPVASSASNGTNTFELYNVSGIKGFWHLDEDSWSGESGEVIDETGINNGTAGGGVSTIAGGKFNRAGDFDYTNDDVNCGNNASLNPNGEITFEAWIKPSNPSGGWQSIIANSPGSGQYNYWFYLQSNDLRLSVYTPSYPLLTVANAIPTADIWYHIAFTAIDGNTMKIFVNGNQVGNDGTAGTGHWSGGYTTISDLRPNRNIRFDGTIDEVRIYNRALSASEISTIYNNYMEKMGSYYNVRKYVSSEPSATIGNETTAASGRFGKAGNFDGTNDYVNCGNNASLNPNGEITFEAWIKPSNPAGSWQSIIANSPAGSQYNYWFYLQSNDLRLSVYTPSYPLLTVANVIPTADIWYHIAFTAIDGNTMKIFVNGNQVGNDGTAGTGHWSGGYTTISDLRPNRNIRFDGTIDEVRIYSRALSADEVRSHYLGGISMHKNSYNNLVFHAGNAVLTTSVSGLSGWHHVAGSWNSSSAYLYLDGVQKDSKTSDITVGGNFGFDSYFGNDENDAMEFDGKMDEVRIVDYARTAFNAGVVINEVCYWPESGDDEWIEIYNGGGSNVDCGGWRFIDAEGNVYEVPSGPNYILSPDEYVTIWLTDDAATDGASDWYTINGPQHSLGAGDLGGEDNDGGDDRIYMYPNATTGYQNLIGFIGWGDGGGSKKALDTEAEAAGIWDMDAVNPYIVDAGENYEYGTGWMSTGATIGLKLNGNNEEAKNDWMAFNPPGTRGNSNSGATPLAVELISFEAIAGYKEVMLSWQTEVEIDNKKWLIARSIKEIEPEIIAEVPAKGVGKRYMHTDSLIEGGVTYWYLLGDISTQGDTTWHNKLLASATPKTYKIVGFALHQNYPNPFIEHTTIRYSVPGRLPGPSKSVRLSIYNVSGRLVHTLLDCEKAPGNYLMKWDGKSARGLPLPSGIYFYNLRVGTKETTNKLFLFH